MTIVSDVAKKAGLSPITVSRLINDSGCFGQATKEKVERMVKGLGYIPDTLARESRPRKTNTLALIVTDIAHPYLTLMAGGAQDVAGACDYTVIYGSTGGFETRQEKYAYNQTQNLASGVWFVPTLGSVKTSEFLYSNDISVAILDRRVWRIGTDCVRADSADGARRLIKLLIGLGRKRITAISGPQKVSTSTVHVGGEAGTRRR